MRPFPVHPRGARKRRVRHETVLLAVPRYSPQWELAAVNALMKPKPATRGAIEHSSPVQPWPTDGGDRVRKVCAILSDRLGVALEPHFPDGNEYAMVLTLPAAAFSEGLATAKVLSIHLPACWLTLGRVFIRDGKFFVRERGYKLTLRRSSHHHVPRELAAKIRGIAIK